MVGLVIAPPPTGTDPATSAPSGTAGSPGPKVFNLGDGKHITRNYAPRVINKNKIPADLSISPDCRSAVNKCSQAEFNSIWDLDSKDNPGLFTESYKPATHTFTDIAAPGKQVRFSDDAKYRVQADGNIRDTTQAGAPVVAQLPTDQSLTTVDKVEKDVVTFKDGSGLVGKAHVPADIHKKEPPYDKTKLGSFRSSPNQVIVPLVNGGLLKRDLDTHGIATVSDRRKETPTSDAETKVTYHTPDGREFAAKAFSVTGNTIKAKDGDESYEVNRVRDAHTVTERDEDERVETVRVNKDKSREVTTYNNDKPERVVIKDKNHDVVATSEDLDDNGDTKSLEFRDRNGNIVSICKMTNCNRETDPKKTRFDGDTVCIGKRADCAPGSSKWIDRDTLNDPDKCAKDTHGCAKLSDADKAEAQGANSDKRSDEFDRDINGYFLGGQSPWPAESGFIGEVLNTFGQRRATSTLLFPETTKEWNDAASKTFDKALLATYTVPTALCGYDSAHKTQVPGSSATFIEVAPGTVQFVGSVQAEKTPEAAPMLCSSELECSVGECIDEICIEDDEVVFGTFYKITWSVSAPADEKHTPYVDENGMAISFNVQIDGDKKFFLYPGDTAGLRSTLRLENGASDRDTFVTYSTNDYTEVCVIFDKKPTDVAENDIDEICARFKESTVGQIEWEDSGRGGSSSSNFGGISTVSDKGRKQI